VSVTRFRSKKVLLKFAQVFFDNRADTFRKDIRVCLTTKEGGDHAYFPALITCIAFAELLGGLHAGRLDYLSLRGLKRYVRKFMRREYTAIRLDLLYEFLRHKIAHLAYPYPVFDTDTKLKTFGHRPRRRRVTWTVYAGKRRPAIKIGYYSRPQQLKKTRHPGPYRLIVEWRSAYRAYETMSLHRSTGLRATFNTFDQVERHANVLQRV